MFKWLEKRAAKQSLLNVGINTRTLVVVSNRADAAIQETVSSNPDDAAKVTKAQEALLTDIRLALTNGATLEQVKEKIDEAKAKETISKGSELAIDHVLSYAEQAEAG